MLGVFLCFRLAAQFEILLGEAHFHTLVYTYCNTVVMAVISVADSTQLVKCTYMSDKADVIGIRKPDKKCWEEESARVDGDYSLSLSERREKIKKVEETR